MFLVHIWDSKNAPLVCHCVQPDSLAYAHPQLMTVNWVVVFSGASVVSFGQVMFECTYY